MLFKYKVIDTEGKEQSGQIEAQDSNLAVSSLQKRGFIVISVVAEAEKTFIQKSLPFFDRIPMKDIVIMSRQTAALFEAQVSAVKVFNLLSENLENKSLRVILQSVSQDIQSGVSISGAMSKYPQAFSNFYVNMVKAGEESGKLTETFNFLADYLERTHELNSKTRNALVYPAFVIFTFIVVMVLMLVMVIPKLSAILIESGQKIPVYTKVVIALSDFFVNYGIFFLLFVVVAGIFAWRSSRSENGQFRIDSLKITLPYFGNLYRKIYLSRIADNMDTMLSAGIPIVRTLEISSDVVDNKVYEGIVSDALNEVKGGSTISAAFGKHPEIPAIMVQMVKVGEETGSLGSILQTLARFYRREVNATVDTLIGLIEPAMIVLLGLGVGFLLTSILVPIYNIASTI